MLASIILKIDYLDPWAWLSQLAVAAVFMVGFLAIYLVLERQAFHNRETPKKIQIACRIGMVAMIYMFGVLLHLQAAGADNTALLFDSLSLFIFVFPVLDEKINLFEYCLRAAGVIGIWATHHTTDFWSVSSLWPLGLLLLWLLSMRFWHFQVRYLLWANMLANVVFGIGFWLTLPASNFTNAAQMRPVQLEGILMFLGMTTGACLYWIYQHRQFARATRLTQVANYDTLTNAKSYSLYQRDVTAMFEEAQKHQTPLTMVALDVDHFKLINDRYGHLAGNQVLVGVATTLSTTLQKYGECHQVYRTGGEEFTMVLPRLTLKASLPIITECWQAVRKAGFTYDKDTIHVTVSMGVTTWRPGDASIEATYKRADDSLYVSKRNGRDAITVDGRMQHTKAEKQLPTTYAFFARGIFDASTKVPKRVQNELLLYRYQRQAGRWAKAANLTLPIDQAIALISDAVVNLAQPRIILGIDQTQFLDPQVQQKLIDYMRSADGPEALTLKLGKLPPLAPFKKAVHDYHVAGIELMLDVSGCQKPTAEQQGQLSLFDSLQCDIPQTQMTAAQIIAQIQWWHDLALQLAIPIVVGGFTEQKEVTWATQTARIHLLSGDFFRKPELPLLN